MKSFSKIIVSAVLALTSMASIVHAAHPADPRGEIVKYSLYGKEYLQISGNGLTATGGAVGSNVNCNFTSPNRLTINGDLICGDELNYDGYGSPGGGGSLILVENVLVQNDVNGGVAQYQKDLQYGGTISGTNSVLGTETNSSPSITTPSLPTYNSLNAAAGSQSISTPTTLNPGSYGNLTVTSTLTLNANDSGVYHFNSLTINSGGSIVIDKDESQVVRILVDGLITFIAGTSLTTTEADDYGKVLLYTTDSVTINSGTQIDASVVAPFSGALVDYGVAINGQVLANKVWIKNWNFDGNLGTFVSFEPVGVSLVGADTYEILEDSDANASTKNTRRILLPIELKQATETDATVDYEIRALNDADSWMGPYTGLNKAKVGTDSINDDIAYGASNGASNSSGTLSFLTGSSTPSDSIWLVIVDDSIPELDAGGKEYFALILDNAVDLVLESDSAAAVADGNQLIYLIPIVSEDVANQNPSDIVLSDTTMLERTKTVLTVSGTDPDGTDANIVFTITGGAQSSLFDLDSIAIGKLVLKSDAVFENASGVLQTNPLEVEITATDEDGGVLARTFNIQIENRNDEKPNSNDDVLAVDEGASNSVDVSTNDNDSIDNLSLSGTYTVLDAGDYSTSVTFVGGVLTYTHNGSENFVDTVQYELNDGGLWAARNKDTAYVIITVTPVNDNSPSLSDDTLTVSESELSGYVLDTLIGIDLDNDVLSFNILTQEHANAFEILNDSILAIDVADSVDYEVDSLHLLEVEVSDGTLKDTAQIWIRITNVNDNAPVVGDTNFTISELINNTDDVGTILFSDLDGGSLTLSIIDQEYPGTYVINNSGLIEVLSNASIDYETDTQHTFKVVVSDGSLSDTANVVVNITNEDDNNPVLNDTAFSVDEDEANSFLVGTLVGSDLDGGALTYRLDSAQVNGAFAISTSGAITIANTNLVDYESETSQLLYASIIDTSGQEDTAIITITINNVNDNEPVVSDTTISMAENKQQGQTVATILASDADNDGLTFTINSQEYNTAFTISTSGVLTLADSTLIDYETDSTHTITVYVTDGLYTDSATVTVNLINVNDGAPVYNDTTLVVDEGAATSTSVGVHTGFDSDGDPLKYYLVSESINGMFEIDSLTGEITVLDGSLIDYEVNTSVSIVVQAHDGVNSTNATITFNVNNVNDNTPVLADTAFTIAESIANSTNIGTLVGSDADGSLNPLSYTLDSAEVSGAFQVSSTGIISVLNTNLIDYESDSVQVLYVSISDGTFDSSAVVTINITNSNDNSPVYNDTTITVAESILNGTSLGSHLASDVDLDALSYVDLSQDPSNTFTITSSGEIILSNELNVDYETDSTLTIVIQVTDGVYFDTATVTIALTDVNDNSPVLNDTSFTISEDIANSSSVGTLVASDADLDALTFELLSQEVSGAFGVNSSGVITVLNTTLVDYESDSLQTLLVRVGDGSYYDTATVTINITNFNDNSPVSVDTTFVVSELDSNNHVVGSVLATDADGDVLTFTIQSQEHNTAFSISTSGQITINDSSLVDFESDVSHAVNVRVSDGTNHVDILVTIQITNANDNAPVIADTTMNVDEGEALGFLVGTLIASDSDGDSLIFSLKSQEHTGAFSIDPDGQVRVNTPDSVDYELDSIHVITVEVSDGVNTTESQLTITINNLNDNLPVIADAVFSIDEDVPVGFDVGSVIATDNDNSIIEYSIESQTYSNAFSYINGLIEVLDSSQIDFETDDTHYLTLRAVSGGDTVFASVIINIRDVNDNLPTVNSDTIYVSEDASVNTFLVFVQGEDLDKDDVFRYSFISGNTDSDLKIDSLSGRLSTRNVLDFETTPQYDLRIAAVTGSDTAVSTILVIVQNVNVSPVITADTLRIDENTSSGTVVSGNITGEDEDNNVIIWTLPIDSNSQNGLFEIDSLTGQLTLKSDSTVNYEVLDTLLVLIAATDDSSSTYEYVKIIVGNVNDAPVISTSPIDVSEDVPDNVVIGQVVANDEDTDAVLTYEILTDSLFTVDSLTGQIKLKPGENLDFEAVEYYDITVVVSDGEYSDTATVRINVQNIVETAEIEIAEIIDESGRKVIGPDVDEFFTADDSITIVYNKDGVLDSITYSVEEGLNVISETNNDPTKDNHNTVSVDVTVSKVVPDLEIVVTDSVPLDTTENVYYVNDLDEDSIWVVIEYIDENLNKVTKDSLISLEDFIEEGVLTDKVIRFEDVYGNLDSITISVVLDTTAPELYIITPEHKAKVDTLELDVEWLVLDNGDSIYFSDVQLLSSGTFAITRTYTDFAGNSVSATHIVTVDANDTGADIKVIDPLVQQKSDQELVEYFEQRNRDSDPAFDNVTLDTDGDGIPDIERANITVILPNGRVDSTGNRIGVELGVQTDEGIIKREVASEFEFKESETKFGLNLTLKFPINGGTSSSGNSRAGRIPDSLQVACGNDSTIFKLRVEKIQFHIFDHLGQYVSKLLFEGFDLDDPRYQNDDGEVNLMLEIPQLRDGLQSEAGDYWGTGVYIMSGIVQTSATPRECLSHINTLRKRGSTTNLLERVGYKRRDY